jgi:hypothetical protein
MKLNTLPIYLEKSGGSVFTIESKLFMFIEKNKIIIKTNINIKTMFKYLNSNVLLKKYTSKLNKKLTIFTNRNKNQESPVIKNDIL